MNQSLALNAVQFESPRSALVRILTGKEIHQLAESGQIFRANFNHHHCETMFYSLTLGRQVQSVTKRDQTFRELDGPLVLSPGEVMNVEIHERFNFNDAEGRPRYGGLIVSRARLLAGGISHPPTAVDPGATRATYLTLINHTNFPGPRMFPGTEKIAKMIVFEFGLENIPDAWELTPPYALVSEEEMPQFWPLSPEPWSPAITIDLATLADLRHSHGPPFDILASSTLEIVERLDAVATKLDGVVAVAQRNDEAIESINGRLSSLDMRVGVAMQDVAFTKGEVQSWLDARLQAAEQVAVAKTERTRFNINLWVLVIVTLFSAIVGAALALWWR
jgi:hypothetical protein